jgi:hypothetical protein
MAINGLMNVLIYKQPTTHSNAKAIDGAAINIRVILATR